MLFVNLNCEMAVFVLNGILLKNKGVKYLYCVVISFLHELDL